MATRTWQTPYGTAKASGPPPRRRGGIGGHVPHPYVARTAPAGPAWWEKLAYSPEYLAEKYGPWWEKTDWFETPTASATPGAPAPSMRPSPRGGPAALAAMRTPEYREQWYPPDWQPSGIEFEPFGGPAAAGALGGDPRRVEWYPSGRPTGAITSPATEPAGPWSPGLTTPGATPVPTDVLPAWFTGAPGTPVTPPAYHMPNFPSAEAYANAFRQTETYRATQPPTGRVSGGAGDAVGGGGGAPAGTPTTTGAFGPFGSIEDWRNQFYSEHGRWPTDVDAQDAIASFGFLGQTGRPPTQKEWEDRWHGGYGGTTQWGPMGGQYGYGGGGGWAPPPEPSWWGGNVWGDEGWAYLPTGPGKYPYPKPERTEGAADWYNIKDIKAFQQVDPQWRDWLQQAMQSQQQHWEDPLMAPIQWMQPAQSEL